MKIRNSITIIGRIGKDPEHRSLKSGAQVCNFSVATTEKYKNQQGETVEETQWHTVIAWRKLGEIVSNYAKKGDEVAVRGKMTYRKWEDKDGNARLSAEIVADDFLILSSKQRLSPEPSNAQGERKIGADEDLPF